jgi:hypothetical protein
VLRALSDVPSSIEAAVGSGGSVVAMRPIDGTPLSVGGKPTVLFVGGLFCPFCAAERWAVVQAMSRFGKFTGLTQMRSSEAGLATFDFAKASYSSQYLAFNGVEIDGQNHKKFQRLTSAQSAIFDKYSSSHGFPFLYVDGKYVQTGVGYDASVLVGLSHQQIAAQLADPSSPVAAAILGEANVLTAAICDATGDAAHAVCANTAVSSLESRLSGATSG